MTDFEQAASKAFEFHFPNAEAKGCYFHFRQSVRRWVSTNGFKKKYDDNIFFRIWVKKLTAIAMVPQDRMDEAFQMVIECKPEDLDVQPI
ncbi:unnamed protein product, partial [Brachionus calyciflorus]